MRESSTEHFAQFQSCTDGSGIRNSTFAEDESTPPSPSSPPSMVNDSSSTTKRKTTPESPTSQDRDTDADWITLKKLNVGLLILMKYVGIPCVILLFTSPFIQEMLQVVDYLNFLFQNAAITVYYITLFLLK